MNYINNNNYRPQQNQGWNQQRPNYSGNYQGNNSYNNFNNNLPPLRELVQNQGKILDNLAKKLISNDKTLKQLITEWKVFLLQLRSSIALTKW